MTLEKAIEFGKIFLKTIEDEKGSAIYEFVETAVKMMEKEPKTGHWERISIDKYVQHAMAFYRCSECGAETIGVHNFCPNCGCRIIGGSE